MTIDDITKMNLFEHVDVPKEKRQDITNICNGSGSEKDKIEDERVCYFGNIFKCDYMHHTYGERKDEIIICRYERLS